MADHVITDTTPKASVHLLTETERERLGRLRAEAELAELRARLAEDTFRRAAQNMASIRGVVTDFEIDWDRGVLTSKS